MIYTSDTHVEAACTWWSTLLAAASPAPTDGQLHMFKRRLAYEITTLAAQREWDGERLGELEINGLSWQIEIALLVSGLRETGASLPAGARTLIGQQTVLASASDAQQAELLQLPSAARH